MIGKTAKIILSVLSVGIGTTGVVATVSQTNQVDQQTQHVQVAEPQITRIKEYETVVVPFETTAQDDNTLAKGATKTVTEGVNGEKIITYEVTYVDGVETSRIIKSSEVAVQPVTKVVANGTYVAPAPSTSTSTCTNGTYVNSAGNTVCRPSSTNTGGATARCGDGTYSYSQSRRGTCSSHGGVAQWL